MPTLESQDYNEGGKVSKSSKGAQPKQKPALMKSRLSAFEENPKSLAAKRKL